MKVEVLCPAKINTFLAVGLPDASGFHPISTVMQAVGLFDVLTIEHSAETAITCDWPGLPAENTLTRVMRFLGEFALIPPVHVQLKKRIPAQSGLGGGSSDAAGLIRGLQPFLPRPLEPAMLFDVAGAVGKDVPFFLVGGRAHCTGYGDVVTPLRDLPEEWLVIAQPSVECPTGPMYAALDAKGLAAEMPEIGVEHYNDFERVAPCECLELLDRMKAAGAHRSGLTGSGSAVYSLMPSKFEAEQLASALSAPFVAVVPTIDRTASLTVTTLSP